MTLPRTDPGARGARCPAAAVAPDAGRPAIARERVREWRRWILVAAALLLAGVTLALAGVHALWVSMVFGVGFLAALPALLDPPRASRVAIEDSFLVADRFWRTRADRYRIDLRRCERVLWAPGSGSSDQLCLVSSPCILVLFPGRLGLESRELRRFGERVAMHAGVEMEVVRELEYDTMVKAHAGPWRVLFRHRLPEDFAEHYRLDEALEAGSARR